MAPPTVTLNNGSKIPQLGLGVFQIKPSDTVHTVTNALEVGYRHVDTAQMYGNEQEVGDAITRFDADASEVWVTTKLNNNKHGFDDALRAFDESYEKLQRLQVDLFLIHWPLPTVSNFVETWRAMERIYAEGRVRAVGVSNFQAEHLDRLRNETDLVPAVNQIELHPYLTQEKLRRYDEDHGIATESWSPIAQGGVLDDPAIKAVSEAHSKTPAQVVLRWHVQLGCIVFPKSSTPSRIRENFDIFGFELSPVEMDAISALNKNERTGPDPDTFDMIPPG